MAKTSVGQRIQFALALLMVILLVFATNQIDRHHFENAQEILRSVHEDRLVALGYIYELDQLMDEKQVNYALADSTESASSSGLNASMDAIIAKYKATRLTPDEAAYFEKLQRSIDRLKELEQSTPLHASGALPSSLASVHDNIHSYLDALAEIQQGEGRRMTEIAQESLDQNAFMSRIEMGLVILIGIVLQVALFSKRW